MYLSAGREAEASEWERIQNEPDALYEKDYSGDRTYDQPVSKKELKDSLKKNYLRTLEGLRKLQADRDERYQTVTKRIAEIEADFTLENVELIGQIANFAFTAVDMEEKLRTLAVEHFNMTGEKTLDENLSVQVRTKLQYDEQHAVNWAKVNAPIMVKETIDKKAFEKFADGLEFVAVKHTTSAVLKGLK